MKKDEAGLGQRALLILAVCVLSVGCNVRTARALASADAQALLAQSYSLEAQGQVSAAIAKMAVLFKSEPTGYWINLRMGWLFLSDRKFKNAIDHYYRAAEAHPRSLEPLLGLSRTFLAAEDYTKALEVCRRLLQLDPYNYYGSQLMAQALIRLKLFGEALETTKKALTSYPSDPVFLEQQGYVLRQLGQEAEARRVLFDLLMVSPGNGYAQTALGELGRK